MLWTIFVILLVLWLLGFSFHIAGGLIHILLVVALIVLVINLVYRTPQRFMKRLEPRCSWPARAPKCRKPEDPTFPGEVIPFIQSSACPVENLSPKECAGLSAAALACDALEPITEPTL